MYHNENMFTRFFETIIIFGSITIMVSICTNSLKSLFTSSPDLSFLHCIHCILGYTLETTIIFGFTTFMVWIATLPFRPPTKYPTTKIDNLSDQIHILNQSIKQSNKAIGILKQELISLKQQQPIQHTPIFMAEATAPSRDQL